MHSFCFLASTELIHIPNCNILYLHSNYMNSLKRVFLKKVGRGGGEGGERKKDIATNITVTKNSRNKVGV